ncbi:unnamed protein product, partial [Clonostachys rhizophaga]
MLPSLRADSTLGPKASSIPAFTAEQLIVSQATNFFTTCGFCVTKVSSRSRKSLAKDVKLVVFKSSGTDDCP